METHSLQMGRFYLPANTLNQNFTSMTDFPLLCAVRDRHLKSLYNASVDTQYKDFVLHEDLLYAVFQRRRRCWNNRNARETFVRFKRLAARRDEEILFLTHLEEHAKICNNVIEETEKSKAEPNCRRKRSSWQKTVDTSNSAQPDHYSRRASGGNAKKMATLRKPHLIHVANREMKIAGCSEELFFNCSVF